MADKNNSSEEKLVPLGGQQFILPSDTSTSLSRLASKNVAYDQQTIPANPNIYPDDAPEAKNNYIVLSIIFLLIFLIAATILFALGVAYHYINLRNPDVSQPIEEFVHRLPFMP